MQGNGGNSNRDKEKLLAETEQKDLDQIEDVLKDEQALLAKLEKLADSLFDLAKDWDPVNPQIAAKVREEEAQTRSMIRGLAHLGELTADQAQKVMVDIREHLSKARSGA